jgi:hypothetical protein
MARPGTAVQVKPAPLLVSALTDRRMDNVVADWLIALLILTLLAWSGVAVTALTRLFSRR